ncbi:MAG: hypothetical protein GXY05_03875, partial [Clostridiales bacterium]|nr:hypothetical protein [Clostridiales bacterium]
MWCYTLLPKILNMSLTAGIVIILVLLARVLLKKAPKIFSYALWVVVLFRLLCPISFSSEFSLLGVFHSPAVTDGSITYIPTDIVHTEYPQVDLPLPGVSKAINENLPQGREQIAADPLEFPMSSATMLWLFGIMSMLIYSTASLYLLRRKLIGSVRLRENIYLADHIATPFVIGVIRPKIYLPSILSEQERDYIILHERTHIRRLDHIVKLLSFLALALHWFNPLVWAAFVLSGKDMEMSCDEAVMKRMDGDIRADYSASLLSLATGRKIVAGIPLAFGEGDTKSRIKNVMNYKKHAFWVIVMAVIAVAAVSIGLLANPQEEYETYTVEGISVSVPKEYADLVVVDTEGNDEWMHEVIALYYKPAYDEHVDFGWMFSIRRCDYVQWLTMLNEASDGVYFKATDGENYYFYHQPTDVQWSTQEQFDEYSKICDSISVSYGELEAISGSALFSYSVSDIEKIEFQNGNTGELVSYTGETEINDIIEHLNAFRYDSIEPAGDGWPYAVRLWFKDGSDMQRIELWPSRASIGGNRYISSEQEYFPQEWLEKYNPSAAVAPLTPISPKLSPDQAIGIGMPQLDYADDNIVIFHGDFGMFVFDLKTQTIIRSLDLGPIGCDQT